MSSTTLDTSIASIINIQNVGKSEVVIVDFNAIDGVWDGAYTFKLYDGKHKNDVVPTTGVITNDEAKITLSIDAENNSLEPGCYWYEVFNTTTKRVEFKGDLEIEE